MSAPSAPLPWAAFREQVCVPSVQGAAQLDGQCLQVVLTYAFLQHGPAWHMKPF